MISEFKTIVESILINEQSSFITKIKSRDIQFIKNLIVKTFSRFVSKSEMLQELKSINWSISVKLVVDGTIVGAYLFNDDQNVYDYINDDPDYVVHEDLTDYKNKSGIKGVAVVVVSEYRNSGLGKMLINYPKSLGYDYIWGEQMINLNNLEDWKKRRRLVATGSSSYITLQDLK